jgi:hypothetical protein
MKQPANYADWIFDSVVENVKLKHIITLRLILIWMGTTNGPMRP